VGLADELLQDAREMETAGNVERRPSYMRRSISTAYYAVFRLFVEDFVEYWEFEDQRARLGRMFNHGPMRNTVYSPRDVRTSVTRGEDVFTKWRNIKGEAIARHHLLSMFGAKSE
jgi:hypothetical protein